MHIDYYPGCTIKTSARQYETSALAVLHALDVQSREMEQWNCCGVVHSLATDNLIRHVAPIRVLTRLQQQGGTELVTLCDMCYNTLAQANLLVQRQPDKGEAINGFIADDQTYGGQVDVLHLLQILRDRIGFQAIKRQVICPLKGLTVFPYYGCKLLRPRAVGIDDAETPSILRDLMQALGATVVDDPIQTCCCGSYHVVNRDAIVAGQVTKIAARAQLQGADIIVLSCPLCHFNLDTHQPPPTDGGQRLPVLYYTQLIGLAFGLPWETLGLDAHHIDPFPLLQHQHSAPLEGERV